MTAATAAGTALEEKPARKPEGECRTAECSQPVYGTTVLCTPCMILFGPYEIVMANPTVTEWLPGDGPEPAPEPTPTPRTRKGGPKRKPDAG